MSTEQDLVRRLTERIAKRVAQSPAVSGTSKLGGSNDEVIEDLEALRESLSEIQRRLEQLESRLSQEDRDQKQRPFISGEHFSSPSVSFAAPTSAVRSPWLGGSYFPVAHPSQEKFGVEEAAVSELVDYFQGEKKCEVEPGGKPCDHCAMCSSRGF